MSRDFHTLSHFKLNFKKYFQCAVNIILIYISFQGHNDVVSISKRIQIVNEVLGQKVNAGLIKGSVLRWL